MTITDLKIAVNEYITKNHYPPKGILINVRQLHDLFKNGKEWYEVIDRETQTTFMGVPFVVDGLVTTLDVRDKD